MGVINKKVCVLSLSLSLSLSPSLSLSFSLSLSLSLSLLPSDRQVPNSITSSPHFSWAARTSPNPVYPMPKMKTLLLPCLAPSPAEGRLASAIERAAGASVAGRGEKDGECLPDARMDDWAGGLAKDPWENELQRSTKNPAENSESRASPAAPPALLKCAIGASLPVSLSTLVDETLTYVPMPLKNAV